MKKAGKTKQITKKDFQEEKTWFKERVFDILVIFFGSVAVLGFLISLIFLSGITGAVIGTINDNLYGAFILITFLFLLCIFVLLRFVRNKRKPKEIDIKKIIEEIER